MRKFDLDALLMLFVIVSVTVLGTLAILEFSGVADIWPQWPPAPTPSHVLPAPH